MAGLGVLITSVIFITIVTGDTVQLVALVGLTALTSAPNPATTICTNVSGKRLGTMMTMKFLITTLLSVLTIGLFGQTVDSLGLDNNPRLNKYEADYFNNEFKDQRKDFDFLDKKIAFITGSSASKHWTKTEYFKELKERLSSNSGITDSPIFLTTDEKVKSGGYDVIVASWVKLLTDKRRRKIITELSYKK